jgi:beta-lactamase class C
VQPVVEEVLRANAVPGLVIAAARGAEPAEHLVVGTDGSGRALAIESLVPVASVTKLATALAVLRLADRGALLLDDALVLHAPDASAADEGITLRTLLCHTAGLRYEVATAWTPGRRRLGWPDLTRAYLAAAPVAPPGTLVNYSNVGYGLLGIVVERVTGQRFPVALDELVLTPLGIEGYLGVEPPRLPARITGDLGEHAGTDREPYNTPHWRAQGSPGGGLVTTAAGALGLVQAFTGQPTEFLSSATLAEATRDQTGGLPGGIMAGVLEWPRCPWGLGVELRGEKTPHLAPAEAAPTSFGHGGASGALVWVDPTVGVAWAMLGTRTFLSWWRAWPKIGAAVLQAMR